MNRMFRSLLTISCLIGAGAGIAAAADTPASPGASAADSGTLMEVVVTARRYAEDLQNVPLAVTALSAAALETQDVTNLQDMNSFVPNMKISADRATTATINVYIRGVGQADPLWGNEPAVGVYIDDVYLARPQAALLDVLDVQDIEVLRGPQGTLYGKNTIAGAIKYVTRDIDGPASLTASETVGNYNEHDEKLSFSMPLIEDHVYFGVSLAELQHDGYGQVVPQTGIPPSPYNYYGEPLSNKDVFAARANLTIKWGESSKLRIVADDVLDNSNAAGGQVENTVFFPQLSNPFDMRNDMPVNEDYSHRSSLSGTYTQNLTDQLSMKLVAGYIEGKSQQFINFAEQNFNLFEVPGYFHDQQSSGEAQLTFKNDLVTAVGGLYYLDGTACGDYNASIDAVTVYVTELVEGCVLTKSSAIYGDTAWKLTDRLNLDAGLRWNEDQKTAGVYQGDYVSLPPTQLLPNQQFFNPAAVPAGFIPAPGVVTNYTGQRSFVNVTPRLGLDYHFTDHVMAYVSYSRGFLSGGFDMRGNALLYPQTQNGYNSETADSYEAGIKSTLLDDTLLLNFTVFYDPYKNAQIPIQQLVQEPGGSTANLTAEINAGEQVNQGAELESVWRPTKALTIALNVGYLDSYYLDFLIPCNVFTAAAGCAGNTGNVNVASENRPINAPMWTASTNATYAWNLGSGSLLARAGYDWRSFTKVAATFASPTDQPAYGLLNAGLAYTTTSKAWRFSIDGKNLTDKFHRVAGYDFGAISQIGYYGPPRTITGTAAYHF